MKFNNFWFILVLTSAQWYVVNFNQIRMDLSISDACKCSDKKLLSGEALENTTLKNGHASRAKMFCTVKCFTSTNPRMVRLYVDQIWIFYIEKYKFEPVFSKWCVDKLILRFFQTCLWPRSIYRRSRRCWSRQKFMKMWQNVYKGPN